MAPFERALAHWLDLSATVPPEHIQLLRRLGQTTEKTGEYKFDIGQAVQFSPLCALVLPGLYVVTGRCFPKRDGEFEYCIYKDGEPYERVAKEAQNFARHFL